MPDSKTRTEDNNHHDWESLAQQCQDLLPGIIWNVCQRFHRYLMPDKIEDYVGEMLLHLLADDSHYLKTYDPEKGSLKTWLNVVTEHKLGYEFKHERPWNRLDDIPPEQLLELPQQERNVITQEEIEAVVREVAKMSAWQQRLFTLCWEDLSAPEIAKRLNIKAASVHRMKHALFQKIRARIEKNGGGKLRARVDEKKNEPEWKK